MPKNPRQLRPPLTSRDGFFLHYASSKKRRGERVFCLQIGANDGITYDPVHKYFRDYGWHGLLIEPQKDVYEQRLCKTYTNNDRVILENVALGNTEAALPFYRIALTDSIWATGLSSFDRRNIEAHLENGYIRNKAREEGIELPQDIDEIIETILVPTTTLNRLLEKHSISSINVVCIDTEGYDFEILKMIDFKKLSPEVVLFESKNLSDVDFVSAKKLLTSNGYSLFWEKGDTLAIKYPYSILQKMVGKMTALIKKI